MFKLIKILKLIKYNLSKIFVNIKIINIQFMANKSILNFFKKLEIFFCLKFDKMSKLNYIVYK